MRIEISARRLNLHDRFRIIVWSDTAAASFLRRLFFYRRRSLMEQMLYSKWDLQEQEELKKNS